MIPGMAAMTTGAARRDLRRDPRNGMVAGVCAGLSKRLGVDPLLLRIVFAATTIASGVGLVAYVMAWILMPAEQADDGSLQAAISGHGRRGTVEVALGAGLLLLAVLLAFRALGLPFSDVLIWPLALVAAGGALIWHRSTGARTPSPPEPAPRAAPDRERGAGDRERGRRRCPRLRRRRRRVAARGHLAHRDRRHARRSPRRSSSCSSAARSRRRRTSRSRRSSSRSRSASSSPRGSCACCRR